VNDEEFITRDEDFHHADHLRMPFLYLCQYPILGALERFSRARQRFATANGKPNLYHETITWAFLFLIREHLMLQSFCQGAQPSWNEFAAENSDLLDRNSKLILGDYYFDETLAPELAKTIFILPNRNLSGHGRGDS